MRTNTAGALISVENVSEVNGACFCSVCQETFTPSLERDCFVVEEKRDREGEMPLMCERCFDESMLSRGIGVVDMSQPANVKITMPMERGKAKWWQFWKRS